jgi:hypothetical protein
MIGLLRKDGPYSTTSVIALVILASGLGLGIVALRGISQHGKQGVVLPSFVGIGLSLILIPVAVVNLQYTLKYHATLRPAVHSASAHLLKDENLRFSIDVPAEFREFPDAKEPPVVHAFIRGSSLLRQEITVITIEKLETRLSKYSRLTSAQFQPDVNAVIEQRDWRGLKIDVAVIDPKDRVYPTLIYKLNVPLSPQAIQVNIAGQPHRREELAHLADWLLDSLDGETNW